MELGKIFGAPGSTIVWGDDRPLLNWVAYALASVTSSEFKWTDIQFPGQALGPTDPLSRHLIPPDRLRVVRASDMAPNNAAANMPVSAVIRSDETPGNVERLLDFLRLPASTQRLLETPPPGAQPRVAVLSNGQRIVALYPTPQAIAPTIRAIVEAGTIMIMTFADAGPEGRFQFDNVLNVEGSVTRGWQEATLKVEKWSPSGPFRVGTALRLGDLAPLAAVIARGLSYGTAVPAVSPAR